MYSDDDCQNKIKDSGIKRSTCCLDNVRKLVLSHDVFPSWLSNANPGTSV